MVDRMDRFNEILDECVNLIALKGETVESCLTRYPEQAAELEPYLRMATKVARTYTVNTTGAAKERARQRLYAERILLRQRSGGKERRRDSGGVGVFGWFPRWATVTAIAVLVILFSSVGVVAASANASPGNLLYPVKRSAEQAILSFQFSPEGKARLNLSYAQRRADEMVTVIKEGNAPQLASLKEDLKQNLDTFTQVIGQVGNEQEKAGLQTLFQENAVQSLNNIQIATEQVPEDKRQAAMDSFQASSQTFALAVETATAESPKPVVTARSPGILQLLATDPPPPNVEKVLITVNQIDISTSDKGPWINIIQEPQTFDLLRVAEVQKFLGQKPVEPGTYTQVRFLITGATVVIGGVERPAKVPGEMLKLGRPFIVEEGKTTSVTLDFDGARTLQIVGQDDFIIKPVVNVLVHKQGQREKEDEKEKQKRGPDKVTEKVRRTEFEGQVESIAANRIVVHGVTITLAPSTRIEGKPEVGQKVEVETLIQPDGTYLAIKVEAKGEGKKDEKSSRNERGGASGRTVEISGAIQSITATEWIVDGQKVKLTAQTGVKGQATVGSTIKIEGTQQADGSILASEITIVSSVKPQEKKEEEGRQEQRKPDSRFTGTIEKVSPNELVINGRAVIITRETKIEGVTAVGAGAEVEGLLQPDGKVQAASIKMTKKAEERDKDEGKEKNIPQQSGTPDRRDEERDRRGQSSQNGQIFSGTIEKIGSGEWTVSGKTILISRDTRLEGNPVIGVKVSGEGTLLPEGKIAASSVKVESRSGNEGRGGDETPKTQERQRDERESPQRNTTTISGNIAKVSSTELTIEGKTVSIRLDTRIEGTPEIGLKAQVEGQQQPDGKIIAVSIKITSIPVASPKEKERAKVPGTTPGQREGQDDEKETPQRGSILFTGTVSSFKAPFNEITVDGKVITISTGTAVEGVLAVGRRVRIKGQTGSDGKMVASSITVYDSRSKTAQTR